MGDRPYKSLVVSGDVIISNVRERVWRTRWQEMQGMVKWDGLGMGIEEVIHVRRFVAKVFCDSQTLCLAQSQVIQIPR